MSLKRLAQNLLLALISTCLMFAGLEFAVRRFFPEQRTQMIAHPILHHVHPSESISLEKQPLDEFTPVLVQFNSLGLREEREIGLEKGNNEFRILLLGDSYIEARQVSYDKTMSQQLEKQLNDWAQRSGNGQTFTVINAGVSAYSPSLEYLYLVHEGLPLKPDLVIVYFVLNDVTDDYGYRASMEVDDYGLPLRVSAPEGTLYRIYRPVSWSRSAQLARLGFGRLREMFHARETSLTENPLAVFKDEYDEVEVNAWEDTKRYLAGMQNLLEEMDIPLVLVIIPAPPQVSATQWGVGKVTWGMKPDEVIKSTKMQDILKEHARKHKIYYLDLLPAFKANSELKLFYDYDGHWTAEGNRLAAQETFAFLIANGLLSRP